MSQRSRLIRKTLIFCSLPVVAATLLLIWMQGNNDAPYVAGEEEEGITRSLDRALEKGTSALRFSEVTDEAGIKFEHFPFRRTSQIPEDMGSGGAWGDVDGDGLPDIFLVNFAAPLDASDEEMAKSPATDRLFRNKGDGTFEDITDSSGVGTAHRGMGASFADYDNDGDMDIFVTSWGENILWQNQGDGTFRNATGVAGLSGKGFWAGASWADTDLDGDLDLYVCGYVEYIPEKPGAASTRVGKAEYPFTLNPSSYSPHANRYYVNQGDGTFEERAEEAGVLGKEGRSLAAGWADFDTDGLPDLYITNDVSDNMMFRNLGDGTFKNISYDALVADYRGSMGIAIGDWDGDADMDMFVTHWIAQENALYSNLSSDLAQDGEPSRLQFGDDADRVGLGQIALDLIGWGTAMVDLNNDGWLDLVVANGSTFQQRKDPTLLIPMNPQMFWNKGPKEGFFEVGAEAGIRTDPPGSGRGVAFADYDGDGDADVLISRHGGRARLLRNDSPSGDWIGFRVRAHTGHPSGLGAKIHVRAGGRSLIREVGAGPSYLSQNDLDVLIGLGEAAEIESVEIIWPGGKREVWKGLETNRLWNLEESKEPHVARVPAKGSQESASTTKTLRTSDMSEHALVADVSSKLTREERRKFWKLNAEAQRLFGESQWKKAIAVYTEMTELDPSHEDALYYRGNSLLELDRYAEAVESWRRLIELNSASSRAWVQLGILHTLPEAEHLFDLNAAVSAFQSAHGLNREESKPLILLGEATLAQGELDEARSLLESAYRMNPKATSALYLSGYLAWKEGNADRAVELVVRAVGSMEADRPVRGVLGEGDTRSDDMRIARRKAAERRLFAGCLKGLRTVAEDPDLERLFPCVDQERAALQKRS